MSEGKIQSFTGVWETDCEGRREVGFIGLFTNEKLVPEGTFFSPRETKVAEVDGFFYRIDPLFKPVPVDRIDVNLKVSEKEERAAAISKLTMRERMLLGIREV